MEGLLGKDFVYAGIGASHHEKAGRKWRKTASKRAQIRESAAKRGQ